MFAGQGFGPSLSCSFLGLWSDDMKFTIKKVCGKAASVGAGVLSLAGVASAAVPDEVTTAMSDMKTDALLVAAGFLVCLIAVTAFQMMRKGAKG